MNKIVLIGAGPHTKVVADIILQNNEYVISGLVDPQVREGFMNLKVLGSDDCLKEIYEQGTRKAFISIGNNKIRKEVTKKAEKIGFEIINVISRFAVISNFVSFGKGIVVMPGAIVNACTSIADGCILNTNCSVDHDGKIGKFVHIAPGTVIAGSVAIGDYTFCGAGSRVIDGIVIGSNVMIGAGAVVVKDINDDVTAVGVPARVV